MSVTTTPAAGSLNEIIKNLFNAWGSLDRTVIELSGVRFDAGNSFASQTSQ